MHHLIVQCSVILFIKQNIFIFLHNCKILPSTPLIDFSSVMGLKHFTVVKSQKRFLDIQVMRKNEKREKKNPVSSIHHKQRADFSYSKAQRPRPLFELSSGYFSSSVSDRKIAHCHREPSIFVSRSFLENSVLRSVGLDTSVINQLHPRVCVSACVRRSICVFVCVQ